MPKNKKRIHLMMQIAGFFLIGVMITGCFTFVMMRFETKSSIEKQVETHANEISNEVMRAVREYPAYEWLLSYWHTYADSLNIEYDVEYSEVTETAQKCRLWGERHPDIQLKYATQADLESVSEADQQLYAEIAYSWLITHINQIKQTYDIDYLFCVTTDADFTTQFFLFSAADPNAVRGTNYEEVYTLGTSVSVGQSQQNAMKSAARDASYLADAGDYVDYYAYVENINGRPVLIGLTYNLSDLRADIAAQTIRGSVFSMILQIVLSVICLLIIILLVLKPLKRIQKNIRLFQQDKESAVIVNNLSVIRSRNEIGQLAQDVSALAIEIDEYLNKIQTIAAEKERIGTELNIASQIQEASIPSIFPAYPDRKEFDLYASMTPAKEVGGDFYDFFLVDDDHLAIVMADVSGKGVPAALFMMVTKILINDRTVMGGTPGEILSFVNDRICENNKADMFVTVWMGILEISTGIITAANAGHDDPAICRKGANFEIVKNRHGPVIGAMEGIRYKDFEIRLQPGDKLFLYTDGVPEATNAENRMLTLDGMLSALNDAKQFCPKDILSAVWDHVNFFVGDAPQFDDLTMLCLEMRENATMQKTLTIEATNNKLPDVTAFVDAFLEALDCPMQTQMQIDLCVEEVFVNIASYAYDEQTGNAEIRLSAQNGVVTLTFLDRGVPYDPLAKTDPDTTLSADDRQIGGLGIFLVKKNMDSINYRYENGQNILTMTKVI